MTTAPNSAHGSPVDCPLRLQALRETSLLDSPPEAAFDGLTRIAVLATGAPVALISLVDAHRQFFKSRAGAPEVEPRARETPLAYSYCRFAVESGEPLIIEDSLEHPLVRDHPATLEAGIRAYVGIPLRTPSGHVLGTLCVLDTVPHAWSQRDVDILTGLAASAATEVALRRETTARLRLERERAASETRFRDLVDGAHEGVWVLDAVGGTTYVNPRMAEMLGYPAEEIVGRPFFDFMGAAQAFEARTLFARRQRGIAEAHEFVFRRADGSELWTISSASPLYDEHGAFDGAVAFVSDVTERRAAAEALRRSQTRLAEAERIGRTGSWELDIAAGMVHWSAEMYRLLGREPGSGQLTLEEAVAALHPDDLAPLLEIVSASGSGVQPFSYAYRLFWPDGTERSMRGVCEVYYGGDGRPVRAVGSLVDVTEQLAAEQAMRESEARLRLALDMENMVVWEREIASDRVIARVRPGCATGADESPLPFGTYAGFLASVHPEDRDRVRSVHEEAIAAGERWTLEYRASDGQGGWRWKQSSGRALADAAGKPSRVIGVTRDVTERMALEAQLRQAQKIEAVGQLAGGLAHDFNNLLTVITGGVRFAREAAPPDSPVHEELSMIEDAADRATQLTRQLLAFSRAQVLKPELLDLNHVVQRVQPMLRRLIGEDIQVITIPAERLGSVRADPGQLEQVLINLAVNARDAMPTGGRLFIETETVDVTAAEALRRGGTVAPGPFVRLRVRDTGAGMDEATQARAFEPFFTTKGVGHGTGLGLATVYGIVNQSGGFITVSSEVGVGTTFEISLPEVPGEEHGTADGATSLGTILLVEDDRYVRSLAARVLLRAGYTVLEATDGREALRRVERYGGRIDLVVTDMVMPEMNGRVFAEQFSARTPGAKVLFMSGYTDDEILRRGFFGSGTAFLAKPFTPEQLLTAVEEVLGIATAACA